MTGPRVEAVTEGIPAEAAAVETSGVRTGKPGNLGIWAFILSLLGIIGLLPIVGSVLGLVLGRVALRQAIARPMRGGRGLAVAAVVISIVTLVFLAFAIATYALVVAFLEI